MKPPRIRTPEGLSEDEAALWAKVASTVTPFRDRVTRPVAPPRKVVAVPESVAPPKPRGRVPAPRIVPAPKPAPVPAQGLDSHWDRRLGARALQPDFTLDLHGHNLDQAHRRLDMGLMQAKALGARVVLLVTGRPRPTEAADRGERRGAIRAKVLDWLAAGPHGADIAAVRHAQRRHGGDGALYLVLRRGREG